ncbi:MAG: DNA polymerase III subunit delta [Candidatus Nanopelagicales bacterium]|nr:DNA polymerase III subunit delta [Candidatus Nanopelagicales bacterium]MCF8537113.1 DNA polymerase III subunit delta [Candidatus Nanopelagicales bacterium]MCF8542684.1 DNA polymerase III subunit delta [Candidatus Nanopelagicales bacterium]MCF8557663.1 DNA polymerase III subunit delta [Candidatus Nanopelagicales bacterium]
MTAPRITLAIGGEPVLIDRAVQSVMVAARKGDPQVQRTVIQGSDDEAAHQLREAAAPNLFGDSGVVIIEGIDGADDALASAVREVLADMPDETILVFTHPGGNKGKALLDDIRKAGAEVVDCAAFKKGRSTTDFLTKEFARRKRKVTPDAVATLYDAVGHDLGLLVSAVSQLSADVEADPIDATAVRDYFAGVAEVSSFTIADAVWDKRYAEAFTSLRQAMLTSDSGRVGVTTVSSIASGLRTLVRVGGMPPGASEADIAREAGVPPWKIKILRRQWSRWSGDQRKLAASVVALADADGAMKGGVREGSSLDAEQKLLALEILVAGSARS